MDCQSPPIPPQLSAIERPLGAYRIPILARLHFWAGYIWISGPSLRCRRVHGTLEESEHRASFQKTHHQSIALDNGQRIETLSF